MNLSRCIPNKPLICVLAILALFLALTAYLIIDGLTDEIAPADAIVVLGSKINPDGHPSHRLKARLNRGYELYKRGFGPKIIVSGGTGKEGYSEARVMADYLNGLGVPLSDILLDEEGINTYQTAQATKRIAKDNGFQSLILVSQYFHITRAKLAFRKAGFAKVYSAHAYMFPELRDLYSIPREVIALGYYALRKK